MYLFTFLLFLCSAASPIAIPPNLAPAAAPPEKVFLSTNLGESWVNISEGLPEEVFIRDFLDYDGTFYIVTNRMRLFKLDQGSPCWEEIGSGLPVNEALPTAIIAHENRMVIGTYEHGVYVSDDRGQHWRKPVFNVNQYGVRNLFLHEGLLYAGTDAGILISYDLGETFRKYGKDFEAINAMAVHKGKLIVARQNSAGVVDADGSTWADMHTSKAILQLLVEGEYVYATNYWGEIWRSKDGLSWEKSLKLPNYRSAQSLPEMLWNGFELKLPGQQLDTGVITPTSRGWVVGARDGC